MPAGPPPTGDADPGATGVEPTTTSAPGVNPQAATFAIAATRQVHTGLTADVLDDATFAAILERTCPLVHDGQATGRPAAEVAATVGDSLPTLAGVDPAALRYAVTSFLLFEGCGTSLYANEVQDALAP